MTEENVKTDTIELDDNNQTNQIKIDEIKQNTEKEEQGRGEVKKQITFFKMIINIIIINIIFTLGSLFLYDKYKAIKIKTIDLQGFIQEQKQLYVLKRVTEDDIKKNLDMLEKKITQMPKNTVVITSDVILGKNVEIIKP